MTVQKNFGRPVYKLFSLCTREVFTVPTLHQLAIHVLLTMCIHTKAFYYNLACWPLRHSREKCNLILGAAKIFGPAESFQSVKNIISN